MGRGGDKYLKNERFDHDDFKVNEKA